MADKQFARSGPAELDTLADDDPLSELARIVGYDARPAVQQLQELQRHQEAIRRDPVFDLEDELLRAFDSYDAPRAEPVHPDSGLVEHPTVAAGSAEPGTAVEDTEFVAPVGQSSGESDASGGDHAVEPFMPQEAPTKADVDTTFDLERELELSLGQEEPHSAAEPQVSNVVQLSSPPEAVDSPVFEDWQEPLSSRFETVGKSIERTESFEPLYLDLSEGAPDQADAVQSPVAAAEAPVGAPSEWQVSEQTGHATGAVEPATAAVASDVEVVPVVAEAPVPSARKSSYPFTPTFSRATPVASAVGVSPQRAFATPTAAPAPANAPAAAVLPQPAPAAEPKIVKSEVEAEPTFDFEDFELELADVGLDLDPGEKKAPAAVADEQETGQPVVAHPALVEPAQQPFLQALAAPSLPEAPQEEPPAPAVAVEESPAGDPLPFDPAMIGETETGVAPIAELDVPQLPAIEAEEKPVSYSTDYDLDIDAEMAQLFASPGREAKETPQGTSAVAKPVASAGAAPLASIDDFAEFEKAMEEDFRRSMEQRRNEAQDVDRLATSPRIGGEDYPEEEGYGRRSQRAMLWAASVAGVIILGGAGVYAWMGGSTAAITGDGPKIILADKEPVKVVPEEKGGKTVPNQDKAVYDRVAGEKSEAPRQEALVSTTEEPVDVVQRTLTPENLPLEGNDYDDDALPGISDSEDAETARLMPDGAADGAVAEDEKAPALAPRKVRTMIVKPDGTLVPRDEPAVQPENNAVAAAAEIPASATAEAGTSGTQGTAAVAIAQSEIKPVEQLSARASAEAGTSGTQGEASVAVAQSEIKPAEQPTSAAKVALAEPTDTAGEDLTPVRSVKTTSVGGEPAATPQARPETSASASASGSAENTPPETAAAAPAAPLATASVPPGSYVVQIASLPSEAEAQKSYDNLSKKFAELIGGRGVDIRKAEIAGKGTYYRVRIPAGSREEANALCTRYKSAGGSCLVTK